MSHLDLNLQLNRIGANKRIQPIRRRQRPQVALRVLVERRMTCRAFTADTVVSHAARRTLISASKPTASTSCQTRSIVTLCKLPSWLVLVIRDLSEKARRGLDTDLSDP